MFATHQTLMFRRAAVSAAVLLLAASLGAPAQASAPTLNFSSYAQVYGYLNTSYTSPYLGNLNFSINGARADTYNYSGSGQTTTGVASVNYLVETGHGGTGDFVYDLVTNGGQYGFNYQGQSEVAALNLKTRISSKTVDSGGQAVDNTPNTSMYSYAGAQWSQGFYIGATRTRPTGQYGAILVGITLDGNFPALADPVYNNGGVELYATSSFTDVSGVGYNSNFGLSSYAQDPSWTGAKTVYKKLLFQYGTVFDIGITQYAGVGNNGAADFFNTGRISSIEVPFESTLESGASQAGLGSLAQLYGNVVQSATENDENTNWDFGNGGGGFHPPVPEPETYALMLAGLAALGVLARRRRSA